MIDQLNGICQHALRRQISADDDLIAVGLNANRALNIIKAFYLATGVELDVNIFYSHRSVREITAALINGQSPDPGKIVTLRDGDITRPLFLYAGGVSCFLEMQDMIEALGFSGIIYGIRLTDFHQPPDNPADISQEVAASLAAVKAVAAHGPYRLAGYSFGGVFALNLARRLSTEGDDIGLLVMIDSPQNDHSWSWCQWAGLMRRTLKRQIRQRVTGKTTNKDVSPSVAAIPLLNDSPPRRGHQLAFRFRNPKNPDYPIYAPQWAGGYTPRYDRAARQLLQMKGLFRPRIYKGKVVFIHSQSGSPIDCDARTIWKAYLPNAEWVLAAGTHQSMMVGRNARAIAAMLDERLTG